MDELRIPKIAVEIICHTEKNESIPGSIFIDMCGSGGYSIAQLVEFFDAKQPFFPFRTANSKAILLQKQTVLRADVPGLFREYESQISSVLDTRREVTAHLMNGRALKGFFIIDLPSDHARSLDFLNAGHRFVPFLLDDMLTLLNTKHIYKVEES